MPRVEGVAGCGQRAPPVLGGLGGPVRAAPVLPTHLQPTWISALNRVELGSCKGSACPSAEVGYGREAGTVVVLPGLALSSTESGTSLKVLGDV